MIQKTQAPEKWLGRLKQQEKAKIDRLQQMLRYINTTDCRREQMLAYFGEVLTEKPESCCDNDGAVLSQNENKIQLPTTKLEEWPDILLNLF